jgi:hypothetical protein
MHGDQLRIWPQEPPEGNANGRIQATVEKMDKFRPFPIKNARIDVIFVIHLTKFIDKQLPE